MRRPTCKANRPTRAAGRLCGHAARCAVQGDDNTKRSARTLTVSVRQPLELNAVAVRLPSKVFEVGLRLAPQQGIQADDLRHAGRVAL